MFIRRDVGRYIKQGYTETKIEKTLAEVKFESRSAA